MGYLATLALLDITGVHSVKLVPVFNLKFINYLGIIKFDYKVTRSVDDGSTLLTVCVE